MSTHSQGDRKHLVIIGGGFAGMELAKALSNQPYRVTLLDRNNYFTFQPLLYQVATSGLEPNSVAYPLRRLFQNSDNISFRMMEVERIDPDLKKIYSDKGTLSYDYLVIATGTRPNFFGLERDQLLPLKSVPQALHLRNHILENFEEALTANDGEEKQSLVNFVVVGGGPTGVELAGALGEMKKFVLPRDYPGLDFDCMNIYLFEGLERLLPSMSEEASEKAKDFLEELGVSVHLNTLVKEYDGRQIDTGNGRLLTRNLIWAAGVKAAPPDGLDEQQRDNARLAVDEYQKLKGCQDIFCVGDVAGMITEDFPEGHPMLAPVAIQQGRHLAKNLLRMHSGKPLVPFRYTDRGTMATVGRNRAVADLDRFKFQGVFAWFVWMFVHLITLVGFRNKLVVLINWTYSYFTYDKALRLILSAGEAEREMKKQKEELT